MSTPTRVLISGYYGFGNAGDEAILAGLIEGFRQRAPEAELTVLSGDPGATAREHGVVAAPRGLRSVRHQIKLSDLVISGGGGLLQDVTSWRSPLYYLAVVELARRARRPVAFVGQSVGPLRRPAIRWLARRVLSGVGALAVRDGVSREALFGLGLGREAEVTADLAFLMPPPTEEEIEAARRKAGVAAGEGPVAAVALRPDPAGEGGEDMAGMLGEAIGGVCGELGLRPVLVAMQPSQDVEFAGRVAARMPLGAGAGAPVMSARELLALTAGCDLLIGMRLHALVFAALAGVPPVGISYDPKVDGLMEQLGLEAAASSKRLDSGALRNAIRKTWEGREAVRAALAARAGELRAAALRNVDAAMRLVRGRS